MSNYDGVVLTPNIVQELIQELFAGQTVKRQKIIKTVNDVHRGRGGKLSGARGTRHPVQVALSEMEQSKLVESPEPGLWSILVDGPIMKTLDEFVEWTKQFNPREYVFRGVKDQKYAIQASAYRRPKKDRDFEKFLQVNQELIREARLRGHDQKDGRELKDLEILAELQHFGAATCLIDFSYNAQVALWFACELDYDKLRDYNDSQNVDEPPNSKVVAVRKQSSEFTGITPDLLKKKIDYFLKDGESPQLYHWQPRQQNNRIIVQQSIFLFGDYQFNPSKQCIISGKCREDILKALHKLAGVTEDSLFPDLEGFAHVHRQGVPYTELTASEYKDRGFEAYEKKHYEDAIADYDLAIEKNSNYAEAYYLRGKAHEKISLGDKRAIADYNNAIRLNPNYAEAYYRRGAAKFRLEQYEETVTDCDDAIRLNPNYAEAYYRRGAAKFRLKKDDETIVDSNKAIRLDPNYARAYYLRGAALIRQMLYEDALADFNEAISLDPSFAAVYYLRGIAKAGLMQNASAILDYDMAIQLGYTDAYVYVNRGELKLEFRRFAEAKFDFETALPLAINAHKDELVDRIERNLYDIDSRTAGGFEDE